jgi:hypothetical protein
MLPAQRPIVVGVGTNPKPDRVVVYGGAECAITDPDTDRPKASDPFELQGWVTWTVLQNLEISIRYPLHRPRSRA